jgi:RNA polymerase sigma-70 factor (ECF subfamily)
LGAALEPVLIPLLPRLRRYALTLSRAGDVADDLVQAACERVLTARIELRADFRLDAFMFRVIRNLWYDRLRRQRTRGEEIEITERDDLVALEAERVPERRLLLRRAAEAIDALPAEQREIMVLVCVEGLSYRDAADVLDLPIGTVMSRLARARRKVAEDVGVETGKVL